MFLSMGDVIIFLSMVIGEVLMFLSMGDALMFLSMVIGEVLMFLSMVIGDVLEHCTLYVRGGTVWWAGH